MFHVRCKHLYPLHSLVPRSQLFWTGHLFPETTHRLFTLFLLLETYRKGRSSEMTAGASLSGFGLLVSSLFCFDWLQWIRLDPVNLDHPVDRVSKGRKLELSSEPSLIFRSTMMQPIPYWKPRLQTDFGSLLDTLRRSYRNIWPCAASLELTENWTCVRMGW